MYKYLAKNGCVYVKPSNKGFITVIIINPLFCLAFQVDIPTLITENVAKEGLKHLEMYLSIKEKGIYKIAIAYWRCLLPTLCLMMEKNVLYNNSDKIIDFWVFFSETDIFMTK